jgi:hypothetical protein
VAAPFKIRGGDIMGYKSHYDDSLEVVDDSDVRVQKEYVNNYGYIIHIKYGRGYSRPYDYGINYSIVIHPDDIKRINALKDNEEIRFVDDTNTRYYAKRMGDYVYFDGQHHNEILRAKVSDLIVDPIEDEFNPSDMEGLMNSLTYGDKYNQADPYDLDGKLIDLISDLFSVRVELSDVEGFSYKVGKDRSVYITNGSWDDDTGPGGAWVRESDLNKFGIDLEQFIQWLEDHDALDRTGAPRDTKYDNFYAANESNIKSYNDGGEYAFSLNDHITNDGILKMLNKALSPEVKINNFKDVKKIKWWKHSPTSIAVTLKEMDRDAAAASIINEKNLPKHVTMKDLIFWLEEYGASQAKKPKAPKKFPRSYYD